MNKWIVGLVILIVPAILSCGGFDNFPLPDGFQKVESERYDFRAVTPDGSAITIDKKDREDAKLDYIKGIVKRSLTEYHGYNLTKDAELKVGDEKGWHFVAETMSQGIEYVYMVALYVTRKDVIVLEYGGTKTAAATELDQIFKAIQSWKG